MRSTVPKSKIGADELPAVTQLFTEPYMVRFLLDNTLGAWVGVAPSERIRSAEADTEAALRGNRRFPECH